MNNLQKTEIRQRRLTFFIIIGFAALFFFAMLQRTTTVGFIPVKQEFINLYTVIKLWIAKIFELPFYLERPDIIQHQPLYLETISRFKTTLLTAIGGAAVAVSGAVYQFVFRNDLASPSLLGISYGIDLSILILVAQFSAAAMTMTVEGYLYSYAAAALILLTVLLAGRLAKKGNGDSKVTLMLLAGCVIAQMCSAFVSAGGNLMLPNDYAVYLSLVAEGRGISKLPDLLFLLGTLLLGFIPLLFVKNSMDLISFSDEEVHTMGVNPNHLRIAALICGTLLMTAAVVNCGSVGMLAILVPHLSRYLFGASFKRILLSCAVFGACFLLICRMISVYFSFGSLSLVFTLASVVGLISAPLVFVVMIKRGR